LDLSWDFGRHFSGLADPSAAKLNSELRKPRPIPGFWMLRCQRQNYFLREIGLMNLSPDAAQKKI